MMKRTLIPLLIILPILLPAQSANLNLNFGHTDAVSGLRFSADGKLLLSSSADRTMKLWDVRSGKLLLTSPEIGDPPFARNLFLFPKQKLAAHRTTSAIGNWYTWVWNIEQNPLSDGAALSPRPVTPSDPGFPGLPSGSPKRNYESEMKDVAQTTFADTGGPIYFTNSVGQRHRGFYTYGQYYYDRSGDDMTFYTLWEEEEPVTATFTGLTSVFTFNSGGQYIFGHPERLVQLLVREVKRALRDQ